jgi:hypothetical protein
MNFLFTLISLKQTHALSAFVFNAILIGELNLRLLVLDATYYFLIFFADLIVLI